MWHSGRRSQRRQSAILPPSMRSFFFFAAAMASRHRRMCHLYLGSVGQQMIVDPAGENRVLHRHRSGLRKSLYPAIQFASRGTNLAFLVNLTAGIFNAVTDRLLVNIKSDVIHMSFEEPPWLFSESTFPLSSVFVHHALLLDLAFRQYVQVAANDSSTNAVWPTCEWPTTLFLSFPTTASLWLGKSLCGTTVPGFFTLAGTLSIPAAPDTS